MTDWLTDWLYSPVNKMEVDKWGTGSQVQRAFLGLLTFTRLPTLILNSCIYHRHKHVHLPQHFLTWAEALVQSSTFQPRTHHVRTAWLPRLKEIPNVTLSTGNPKSGRSARDSATCTVRETGGSFTQFWEASGRGEGWVGLRICFVRVKVSLISLTPSFIA